MDNNSNILLSLQWNRLTLEAIKYTHTPLPMAARALAMVHTAMYNAWAVFDNNAIGTCTSQYLKNTGSGKFQNNSSKKSFSYAAYRVLTELFLIHLPAEKKNLFRSLMIGLNYDPNDHSVSVSGACGIGNLMAILVLERYAGDGSNCYGTLHSPAWSDYTGYDKQASGTKNFLVPHWGMVKAFALDYNAQFRPPPPFRKNQTHLKEQVGEILRLSAGLTDEQKVIAEYWNDYPGNSLVSHWCEIAQFVADSNNYGNNDGVKLFFALSNAMLDASIASWDCMRYNDTASPADLIHELYNGRDIVAWGGPNKGAQTIKGEDWKSYIKEPPFPAYVSPQSVVSRAVAFTLQRYTGSDRFSGYTLVERGDSQIEKGLTPGRDIRLEWDTFSEAAKQAGSAGLYGGIYFSRADEEGQELGKSVGQHVWEKAMFYFND